MDVPSQQDSTTRKEIMWQRKHLTCGTTYTAIRPQSHTLNHTHVTWEATSQWYLGPFITINRKKSDYAKYEEYALGLMFMFWCSSNQTISPRLPIIMTMHTQRAQQMLSDHIRLTGFISLCVCVYVWLFIEDCAIRLSVRYIQLIVCDLTHRRTKWSGPRTGHNLETGRMNYLSLLA